MDMVVGVVVLAAPLLAIKLKVGSLGLGGLGFIISIFYVLFCLPFGKLSDRWKREHLILIGCFLYFLSSLGISFATNFFHLLIFMALTGIAGAMFWPSLEAWIAEKGKGKLIKKISFFNISWSLGVAIGPLISGVLFELNYHFPFYLAALVSLVIIYLVLKKLPTSCEKKEKIGTVNNILTVKDHLPQKDFSRSRNSSYLHAAWVANFTGWFVVGTIRYLFPKLSVEMGIKPSILGILVFLFSVSQAFFFYVLSRSPRWHYRLFPLIFFQALGAMGLLLIFFSPSMFTFIFSFIFIGIAGGFTYFSSIFYSLNGTEDKGTKASIHEVFLGTGALAGPLMGGIFAQIYNLRVPYLVAFLIVFAGIIIEIFIIKNLKKISLIP